MQWAGPPGLHALHGYPDQVDWIDLKMGRSPGLNFFGEIFWEITSWGSRMLFLESTGTSKLGTSQRFWLVPSSGRASCVFFGGELNFDEF